MLLILSFYFIYIVYRTRPVFLQSENGSLSAAVVASLRFSTLTYYLTFALFFTNITIIIHIQQTIVGFVPAADGLFLKG